MHTGLDGPRINKPNVKAHQIQKSNQNFQRQKAQSFTIDIPHKTNKRYAYKSQ
jgi:hypothetical protein